MKKRTYRKVAVKDVDVDALASELVGGRAVLAIDVAKVDMVAAIVTADGRVVRTICWKNPGENGLVLGLLASLGRAGVLVEAVMESSGTYGDVLRHQLQERGVPVFRVSGKRTHDAAEVYDGVPSLHDAKSAAIIAKLHLDGVSVPWGPLSEEKRELKAAIATMDLYREQHQRLDTQSGKQQLSTSGAAQRLAPTTGKATAAVLIADVGDRSTMRALVRT